MTPQTVYALSSAPGRAGVAVIRLSGPQAADALEALTGGKLPEPRVAALRRLRDETGALLDEGMVLWFPAPHSFTGEDVAELQVHGGRAVLGAIFAALAKLPGLRLAEPGEFSRRAFEHGKLDLTAAEGLGDLINAETEAQRKQALRQMQGALGQLYEGWRNQLVRALAHLEADIDFPDEDLPAGVAAEVKPQIARLREEIAAHLNDRQRGERLRDGLMVAIVGAPNVGKSSLLNALAKREAAIVSEIPGTTRDVIEVHLDLGGYPVVLADTAGLRESADAIESEGVARALKRAESADLKIVVLDATKKSVPKDTEALIDQDAIVVANKADAANISAGWEINGRAVLPVSVRANTGMNALLDMLEKEVVERIGLTGSATLTRARHREALVDCIAALDRFLRGSERHNTSAELAAEDIRLAARALGRITGRIDVEDLLDVIFRDFCIGK
ncbi:tRNA uridine-5-carboxymethylaminomethyl(34) synthesis GTPase MnmE [Ferrovibrio sp.]|uniref:tRNA uridine-5-carboxymethylaminomethyl(34) synthesis GTPase MnmE n=1 Tax=Ferrovibrio sp. TaxID=1917215 RepID=UPI000CC06BD5|nr:tRNA uridine-5-carboxymethylaminomethyl(34) synthesis GTPase MnmE [Ferrovibrio sp.]PJI38481.1 MAG: tRNA uridine-5-carboxymethylaminomethyl(34) synthesis GTPase MnmE [Ferrovibrio sp.]